MSGSYLVRRNKRYHFRIRVPGHLKDAVGSTEIHRSLRTSDKRVALQLSKILRAKIEAEFAQLTVQNLQTATMLRAAPRADSALSAPITGLNDSTSVTTETTSLSPRISVLMHEYIRDREAQWTHKTKHMHKQNLLDFIEVTGDKAVNRFTRADCRAFKMILLKLPRRYRSRFEGRPLKEIAALEHEPMTVKTVNRMLFTLSGFFTWAETEGYVDSHPARRLTIPVSERADTQRLTFDDGQLRVLFESSPIYVRNFDTGTAALGKNAKGRPSRYWLPLIALFSGMRLEEIAQLHVEDIQSPNGFWIMDVNGRGDRRLKTKGSARTIPIHSQLIDLGFLEYWKQMATKGNARLWPELQRGTHESYSVVFSKWFGDYKRSIGIVDPKVTFHSFRHTFVNALKQLDVNDVLIRELVGHSNNSITMGRYGKRFNVHKLAEAIEKVDYGINIARWSAST